MAYSELKKIAMASCAERGDSDFKTLSQTIRFCNDAVRDLILNTIPIVENVTVKSQILSLRDNKSVYMPPDFIYPLKVGICYNGRIAVIDYDPTLCLDGCTDLITCEDEESAVSCVNGILNGQTTGNDFAFWNTYRNGGYLGEVYGIGGNVNAYGFYKYHKKENLMTFRNVPIGCEIIVEYKSDGVGEGVTLIPSEAEMAVRYYVKRMFAEQKEQLGISRQHDQMYQREVKNLERIYSAANAYVYRNTILTGTANTVRR
jgi:hypothetical protein